MGVVLYILLSGKVPFPGDCNKEIIENVLKGEYHFNHEAFKHVSDQAKDLIVKLLVRDVGKRLSASEAYNHPWIQSIKESEVAFSQEDFQNMNKFMEAATFKKATLIYLASKLPEKDFEELRKLFIAVDHNGDGRITSDEFVEALQAFGI